MGLGSQIQHEEERMPVRCDESLIESLPVGFMALKVYRVSEVSVDLKIVALNPAGESLLGVNRSQCLDQSLIVALPWLNEVHQKVLAKCSMSLQSVSFSEVVAVRDQWLKLTCFSPQPDIVGFLISDVSSTMNPLKDFDVFFNFHPDLLCVVTPEGLFLRVNQAWTTRMGYLPRGLIDDYFVRIVLPEDQIDAQHVLTEPQRSIEHPINLRLMHADGAVRTLEWRAHRERNLIYLVGHDITDSLKHEKDIEYLSFHDALTGLYNRRFMEVELKRLDVPRNYPLTIVQGDVNRLKLVNDAFGHEKGDELICKAAEAIKTSCRPDDLIARWGGDEFVLLLPKTSAEDAQKIIDRIHLTTLSMDVNSIKVSIAFGASTKLEASEDLAHHIRQSENAMYKAKSKDSERNRKDIVDVIASTLYHNVPYEELHAKRVSALCRQLAMALGYSDDDVQKIAVAGLLHDIGKVAISKEILTKDGPLNANERDLMKQHPLIGSSVVGPSENGIDISDAILHHHERLDGTGYPLGITQEEIPIPSRIITIADSYDTMVSQNLYRPPLTKAEAIAELRAHKGTQFDAQLTERFIQDVLKEKALETAN
jgi:diguanylate cyclase (GGDEF)-like protein/PAS domain S-box-containing protein